MNKYYILYMMASGLVFVSAFWFVNCGFTSWQFWVGFCGMLVGIVIIYAAGYKRGRSKQE